MRLLEARGLVKWFGDHHGKVLAVDDFSLDLDAGETVGLIGESGSGKSTVGRLILGLLDTDGGEVWLDGTPLSKLKAVELRRLRRRMQIVFQEPYASLNPKMTAGRNVCEPLQIHAPELSNSERRERARESFREVGLREEMLGRYPRELSGGQQQRVGIARALITRPDLLVLDEPTSSLDVVVRARILVLLRELQNKYGFACLFISHDLATVRSMCHRVAVMYRGQLVEQGTTASIVNSPLHPYTRALISSELRITPSEDVPLVSLGTDSQTSAATDSGCRFLSRCPVSTQACGEGPIQLWRQGGVREVRCIRYEPDGQPARNVGSRVVDD